MPLHPGEKLGPYEILSPIGAGGMGEVYKARDARLERLVAVKVLTERLTGDASALARFEREAKAVAALSHPNILSIFDIGSENGVTYAVMELLEGETLRERLSGGALPVSKATDIAAQIAEGLAAAHEKGITHRDLKPGNVFITKAGRVKILDFGLAKLKAPEPATQGEPLSEIPTMEAHTSAGAVMGTVGYMAPEQARGHPADARSDIFAFGVVLYEMLAGRRAFQGDTASDTLAAILMKDPDPLPPVTPPGLDRIVRRCLEKRPEDRFQSAHDLLLALEVASSQSVPPVSAPAVPVPLPRGLSARHWMMLGGAAVLLALAATGLWLWKGKPSKTAAGTQRQTIKAIALYPLDDLSGDPGQAYFAPGMTDALTTTLTQIRSLKVMGSVSAARCKEEKMPLPKVAEVLGVDAVVMGSVLRVGDTVRISVRLVDAGTDANLWAQSYERKLSDVLVLQGEVAKAVASAVGAAVTPGEQAKLAGRPVDPRAYEEYLNGLYDYNHTPGNEGFLAAIAHFKKATEADPGYAPAYVWMAGTHRAQWESSCVPYDVAYPLAKAAVSKALELDPSLAMAHACAAQIMRNMERDLPGAERETLKAMELDDKDYWALGMYGAILLDRGRVEEALAVAHKRAELDPINPFVWWDLAMPCTAAGRWDEAIGFSEKSLELGFVEASAVCAEIGRVYALKGDQEKALAYAGRAKTYPGWEKEFGVVANLAKCYATSGQRAEAMEMVRRLEPLRMGTGHEEMALGYVYAWLGERDRALGHLEKACAMPPLPIPSIGAEYYPKEFRKDPRFLALVKKAGVPLREEP